MILYRMQKSIQILLIISICLFVRTSCNEFDKRVERKLKDLSAAVKNCTEYFKFARSNEGYIIGELTLPNLKLGDVVTVELKAPRFYGNERNFNGILLPNENSKDIMTKLQKAQNISYRIDFPVAEASLTEWKNIFINDSILCMEMPERHKTRKIILLHKLAVINNTIPVYKSNIYMPYFNEVAAMPCGGYAETETIDEIMLRINADDAAIKRGEFPWLAAIYRKQTFGTSFICTGSLLNAQFILSAAHCIRGLMVAELLVYLGRHKLTEYDVDIVMREIKSINVNSDFHADLALLKLKEPVGFTKFIQPICLWRQATDAAPLNEKSVVVVGWFKNNADDVVNTTSAVPERVKLDIVRAEQQCTYISVRLLPASSNRTYHNSKANSDDANTSGLLMFNQNGTWMLRGMITARFHFQKNCNNFLEYTVYADISRHRSWLNQQIGSQKQSIHPGTIEDICGISSHESQRKFEWLAAIYRRELTGEIFLSTGVLISTRTILIKSSAISTLNHADFLRVYLGRYNLSNINEQNVVTRDVATIIRHPNYQKLYYFDALNDIALIEMKQDVSFTANIKPICLWSNVAAENEIVGEFGTFLGWDQLSVLNESSTIPLTQRVEIVSFERCQQDELTSSSSAAAALSSQLCTIHFGVQRSGFLLLERNGRWYVRAMANNEGITKPFRTFTDIVEFLPWIRSFI